MAKDTYRSGICLEFGSWHPSWVAPNPSPWGPNSLSVPPWAPVLSSTYPHRDTEFQVPESLHLLLWYGEGPTLAVP